MPLWLFNKDASFAKEIYVSALGVGDTLQSSREDAIKQLILYFDSRIKVDSTSDLYMQSGGDSFNKTKKLSSTVKIDAEAELPSLSFTEPFFETNRGEWYICAYINKCEFIKQSVAKVHTGIKNIESSLNNIKGSSHISQFITLSNSLKEIVHLQRKANQISVLDFESAKQINSTIETIKSSCFDKKEALKEKIKFSINIEGDFEDILSSALKEILENEGFIYASDAELALKGNVKISSTENSAGVFVTPRLSIQIIDLTNKEKTLSSYSKSYKKWGHIDKDSATRKALIEVAKDLHSHFIKNLYSL